MESARSGRGGLPLEQAARNRRRKAVLSVVSLSVGLVVGIVAYRSCGRSERDAASRSEASQATEDSRTTGPSVGNGQRRRRAPTLETPPPVTAETRPRIGSRGRSDLRRHPRDPAEWQGMRMLVGSHTQRCEQAQDCSMPKGCIDGRCLPCERDDQCAREEVCVLDHCLLEDLAACRSRSDCDSGEWCVMSGYSKGRRFNSDTRSYCARARTAQP